MDRRRWLWPSFAGLLLAVAVGWGTAVSNAGGHDDAGPPPPDPDTVDSRLADPSGSASPQGSLSPSPPPSPSSRPHLRRVLYLGDSFAMEAQNALREQLRATAPLTYRSEPVAGVTVCDYLQKRPGRSLVPAAHKAAELVREVRPSVVVLQFRGNSWGYTPCMSGLQWGTPAYYARYEHDVRALARQVAAAAKDAGVPVPKLLWVLQPPDPLHPELTRGVNDVYRRRAASAGDLLADTGGVLAGPDGKWAESVACTAYERSHAGYCTDPARNRTRLHRDDDPLHFCLAKSPEGGRPCPQRSPGIERYTRTVARAVERYLS